MRNFPRPFRTQTAARCAAFTLVELMIVLVILIIAAALVIPSAASAGTTRLRSAASLLVADIEFAQLDSIAHPDNRRVVVFDTEADAWHIAAAAFPDTPLTHPATKLPHRVVLGPSAPGPLAGVAIDSVSAGDDDAIGFGVYGQLDQTSAASVTLSAGSRTITITLDPTTGDATTSDIQ